MDPSKSVGLLQPSDIDLADQCFTKPKCDKSAQFRTIDGGCNNLLFPVWGKANTASTRIIQADYSDGNECFFLGGRCSWCWHVIFFWGVRNAILGISVPRKAVSGRALPNARHIRTKLFLDADKPAPTHSLFVMQFGQVVAHDTELTISKTLGECLLTS